MEKANAELQKTQMDLQATLAKTQAELQALQQKYELERRSQLVKVATAEEGGRAEGEEQVTERVQTTEEELGYCEWNGSYLELTEKGKDVPSNQNGVKPS